MVTVPNRYAECRLVPGPHKDNFAGKPDIFYSQKLQTLRHLIRLVKTKLLFLQSKTHFANIFKRQVDGHLAAE